MVHRISTFFCLFLLLLSAAHAAPTHDRLKKADVHRVMDRLLEYHVEVNEVTPEVIRRSYEVYLDRADPDHAYLLESEVAPFIHASPAQLQEAVKQYKRGDYSQYEKLNAVVANGIERARGWRRKLTAEAKKEVLGAKRPAKRKGVFKKWVSTPKELKERQRHQLVLFAENKLRSRPRPEEVDAALQKTWALYNKRANAHENPYLLRDGKGHELPAADREHLIVLRTLKSLAPSLDAHTAFYSPAEAYQMRMQLQQGFTGIGVVLEDDVSGVTVAKVIKGGPADKNGKLQEHDRIIEINGGSIATDSFEEVMDKLRGPRGTTVVLGVERDANGSVAKLAIPLQRDVVALDDAGMGVSYEPFGDGIIGVIKLDSFYEGQNGVSSERDVRQAIRELKKKGNLVGLVLDLRDNLGGFLSQAVKVAGLFITNGVVAMSKYSDGVEVVFREIDGHAYFDGPMVVLTSKVSASAAEIVAQALQDYGQALVVGDQRTFGKGSIQHQTITDENADSFFKVTVGRYYTVSGKSTQIKGVQADIVVPTQLFDATLGEEHLEYPLASDRISPAFEDNLEDLSPGVRQWYAKYYLPTLQKRKTTWDPHIQQLRENSKYRITHNRNYQVFMEIMTADDDEGDGEKKAASFGVADLQLNEAVDIVKDMIVLEGQEQAE